MKEENPIRLEDIMKPLSFEDCPSDPDILRGTDFCRFYDTDKCKRREKCKYFNEQENVRTK